MSKRLMAVVGSCVLLAVVASGQTASKTHNGLEMTVSKVERAPTASLKDCPPGTNAVVATTRPGEQFALVTVAFKVPAGFQASPMKRPSITSTDGKNYNTSGQFVDVGSVPAYSCTFPFRVPDGTKLKSLTIESATFDLTALDSK